MEQVHRDLIRQYYTILADTMKPEVVAVCKELWVKGIISKHMEENIVERSNTNREKAYALLDLMPSRGPRAFQALYESIVKAELHDAADILRPDNAPHMGNERQNVGSPTLPVPQPMSLYDELPDSWPNEETGSFKGLTVEKIKPGSSEHKMYESLLTSKGKLFNYSLQQECKGKVLIFNNENFNDEKKNRDGSLADRRVLEQIFPEIGFERPVVHKDKTAQEMKELLKRACDEDYTNVGCFVLFIMTHGDNGIVFGKDMKYDDNKPMNYLEIQEIRKQVCNVSSLRGKPKLLFIQACQGSRRGNRGSSSNENPGSEPSPPAPAGDSGLSETGDQDQDVDQWTQNAKKMLDEMRPQDSSDSRGETSEAEADCFIAMATVPDKVSWRNTVKGTWFIQAIAYVFAKYAYKYDIYKLMTYVNALVGKAETKKRQKQVALFTSTFQKSFFFFPGLPLKQ